MSFRYTNNLIGVLKHRLALESAHREIVRRTFAGTCNGVEVRCSGYGTVLSIRLLDKEKWEPYYSRKSRSSVPSGAAALEAEPAEEREKQQAPVTGGLDLLKLSHSIKTAAWEANRLIRAAKEEAHARAVLHNPQSRAKGTLSDWYEADATALLPRPCDALKQEVATPWMQAVRFAKANPADFLASASSSGGEAPRVSVLAANDCEPLAIPVGATHPLYTPALTQLEAGPAGTDIAAAAVTGRRNLSRVDPQAVLSEQKKELAGDERQFWERVELIRRGQLASIPGGANKRGYAEMGAVVADNAEEKVELRFTQ